MYESGFQGLVSLRFPTQNSHRIFCWLLADITAHGLAKTVGEYLASRNAENAMQTVLGDAAEQVPAVQDNQEASGSPESSKPSQCRSIRARTARQWLTKLGL
jgi:hypothetical protein